MKMILISEKRLDDLFKETTTKLKADRFSSGIPDAQFENSTVGHIHGAFHYELHKLKDKIIYEPI
jgi:hypothetical protein